jgi:hypothetical protein
VTKRRSRDDKKTITRRRRGDGRDDEKATEEMTSRTAKRRTRGDKRDDEGVTGEMATDEEAKNR